MHRARNSFRRYRASADQARRWQAPVSRAGRSPTVWLQGQHGAGESKLRRPTNARHMRAKHITTSTRSERNIIRRAEGWKRATRATDARTCRGTATGRRAGRRRTATPPPPPPPPGGGGERVRGAHPRPCRPSATPWLGSRKKISTGRSTSRDAPSPADVAAIRPWASRDCGLGQVPLVCVAGGIAETVGVPAGRHADATTRWLGGAARGGRGGGGGWAAHVVDVGGEGQEVEEVREVLPHPSRPVHPQALVVESINLRGVKD